MSIQIRLKQVQITSFSLNAESFDNSITTDGEDNIETSMNIASAFVENQQDLFAILFELDINNVDKTFTLSLKATAHFETTGDIQDEFKTSDFVNISAPAIAFPYIRAFISNTVLNSGYDPIILPSFNFHKLAEEAKKNNDTVRIIE